MKTSLYICEKVHRDYRPIGPYYPPVTEVEDYENTVSIRAAMKGAGPYKTCTYQGPLSAWKGKTALTVPLVAVQFDDQGQYMAYGWHLFNANDWKVPETRPLFQAFASAVVALANCIKNGNQEWYRIWNDCLDGWCKNYMPSGSGFDNGTQIDLEASGEHKLVFNVHYHHMDEHGCYDGWTEHQVIVTPSLLFGFTLRITGPNRNEIKDFISDTFHIALSQQVNPHEYKP
jgi:uncharacterized ParB-like nuclease family protein